MTKQSHKTNTKCFPGKDILENAKKQMGIRIAQSFVKDADRTKTAGTSNKFLRILDMGQIFS